MTSQTSSSCSKAEQVSEEVSKAYLVDEPSPGLIQGFRGHPVRRGERIENPDLAYSVAHKVGRDRRARQSAKRRARRSRPTSEHFICLPGPVRSRSGVILLIVIGCLVFTMIVFASMIDRVRHESKMTARGSINEDLYQLASAIGRLTIRKLGNTIETMDGNGYKDIRNAIFNGTALTGVDFTSDITQLDVIENLKQKDRYKDLVLKVKYSINLDAPFKSGIDTDISGLTPPSAQTERSGKIVVETSVTANRHTKTCKLTKVFYVVCLIPPPFHKFTLFATQGAASKQDIVNSLDNIDDGGQVTDMKPNNTWPPYPPLVLWNRYTPLLAGSDKDINFTANQALDAWMDQQTPVKSGWIYLGGQGTTPRPGIESDRNLVLNVCAGDKSPIELNNFGEGFHYYYEANSSGWISSQEWLGWLNGKLSATQNCAGRVMLTFVDYGFFSKMWKPPSVISFNGIPLFSKAVKTWDTAFPAEGLKYGSRLHLYGTPTKCTPTLVFGQVRRRFIRTFGFYFPEISKVYPIRAFAKGEWEDDSTGNKFWPELKGYMDDKDKEKSGGVAKIYKISGAPEDALIGAMGNIMDNDLKYQAYLNGVDPSNGLLRLIPYFYDEPYCQGLANLCSPKDTQANFDKSLNVVSSTYGSADKLAKDDYAVPSGDTQLHYSGRLKDIKIPKNFLAQKTSYYIDNDKPELSKCQFLIDKGILVAGTPYKLLLNQIIRFKKPLIIDKAIDVVRGGIIICDDSIKISCTIRNPYLAPNSGAPFTPPYTDPNSFGFLTLITSKKIEIDNLAPDPTKDAPLTYPELHAFLIAMNGASGQISTKGPLHIKGGVALDQLDQPKDFNLLQNGGIIEWGFDPKDIDDFNDPANPNYPNFFGLAMGPRDVEVVDEE
ncbi:MAG: hypothetical protein HQM09_04630 [Candidatus Riflebacteria bacterium]|nr:hypothetical protein [Candidatus Riflebacteria bacterium]